MAHELEMVNGNGNMVYVGATPWHGLGVNLEKAPSIAETIKAIGADRKVEKVATYLADGTKLDVCAAVRTNHDGTRTVVGESLGAKYTILQDTAALESLSPLVEGGYATIETAGYLKNGRVMFACAKLAGFEAEVVKGDPTAGYALLTHAHDGSLAIHCGITRVRVVCQNTQSAALRQDGHNFVKLRHTRNAESNLVKVAEMIAHERESFLTHINAMRALSKVAMSDKEFMTFAAKVFGVEEKHNTVSVLFDLFEGGRGTNLEGVRGTRYGAFNAVTEYLTHEAGKTRDGEERANSIGLGGRVLSVNFGKGAQITNKALDFLMAA